MSEDRTDTANLLKAIEFASRKHSTQRRKDKEASPYINHPIAVAHLLADTGGITDLVTLMAAVLHDTIEDTETTAEELEAQFGPTVRKVVEEMTDDKSLEKAVRKQRQIDHAPHLSSRAKAIKLADKIANVQDVTDAPPAHWDLARRIELPGLDGEGRGWLPGNERPAREALRRSAQTGTGEVQKDFDMTAASTGRMTG